MNSCIRLLFFSLNYESAYFVSSVRKSECDCSKRYLQTVSPSILFGTVVDAAIKNW